MGVVTQSRGAYYTWVKTLSSSLDVIVGARVLYSENYENLLMNSRKINMWTG